MYLKIRKLAGLFLLSCVAAAFIHAQNANMHVGVSDNEVATSVNSVDAANSNAVFDPNLWKITFPLENPKTGNALEVLNPEFSSYVSGDEAWPDSLAKYFYTTDEGQAFHCEYTGATTPNSSYGRTELREMVGPDQHNWTLQTGGHLHGRLKITDFKAGANKLFFMQIHGKHPSDEPLLK